MAKKIVGATRKGPTQPLGIRKRIVVNVHTTKSKSGKIDVPAFPGAAVAVKLRDEVAFIVRLLAPLSA